MNWDLSVSWTRTTRIQTQKFKKKKKNILQPSQSLTLGLITFHLLVLLSPSIFHWCNSSLAPPSSSQPVLKFDFSVCSVNRVHQSHRRSGFVTLIWVLGLFVDADLSFCHWVSTSIWVLPLGFSCMVCFAKNCERPPEFARFQSCWIFTNIKFFFFFLGR